MAETKIIEENRSYSKKNKWWTVMQIPKISIVDSPSLHFGKSIELLFLHNVAGIAHIGGKNITFSGDNVFFIPPNIVHSFIYKDGGGSLVGLNLDPEFMKSIFDIPSFLAEYELSYSNLSNIIADFKQIETFTQDICNATEPGDVLLLLIQILNILIKHAESTSAPMEQNSTFDDEICSIITWSKENFRKKILLEEVAANFGYSKYYFCKKFKKITGVTYTAYLTYLRIHQGRSYLSQGYSIKDAAANCGIDDLSYFTQIFKKYFGITPKSFVKQLKENTN